jgi:uncharacterized protein (TIGR02284 family)
MRINENENTNDVLNDLIKINNDRIAGYERALNEMRTEDGDLRNTFESMKSESEKYKNELVNYVKAHDGDVEDDTTISGKIYRAWMEVKNMFTGGDRKELLDSCEFGEDAAQRAYEAALGADVARIDEEARQLIENQQRSLKDSHDTIKGLRDSSR